MTLDVPTRTIEDIEAEQRERIRRLQECFAEEGKGGGSIVAHKRRRKKPQITYLHYRPTVCVEHPEWGVFLTRRAAADKVRTFPNAIVTAVTKGTKCGGFHWRDATTGDVERMGIRPSPPAARRNGEEG